MKINDIFHNPAGCTFVIAEIGSNHHRDLNLTFDTIDAAVEAGADAVKFQSLNIDALYYRPEKEIRQLHEMIDLKESWHARLKDHCDRKGIIFFSTPTYLAAVDILEEIDVALYKLASAQVATFPQLIRKVAGTGKPVILSTGMVTYGELETVISIFREAQQANVAILHCNSIYPTPYEKVNLKLMDVYRSMFHLPVGYSDHTRDIYVPIAAVSLGARIIEKHFTLTRERGGPDAEISLEPDEFKKMVEGIRAVEKAGGFRERTSIETEEKAFKQQLRYRLVVKNEKAAHAAFSPEDFDFLRHPEGINAAQMAFVIAHMEASNDIPKGSLLTWDRVRGKNR